MPISAAQLRMQAPASSRAFSRLAQVAMFAVFSCSAPAPPLHSPKLQPELPPKPARWARFAEVAAWPPVTEQALPSQGHHNAFPYARVRVSPDARDTYIAMVQDSVLPEGSVVALFHESADGVTRGPVYVAQKAGGSWQFLLLDALGHPQAFNRHHCEGCHADAAADQLFGLPRPRPSPAVLTTAE